MNACTEFCQGLASLSPPNGCLPSHADLVSQLNFNQKAKEVGHLLGTWEELTARKSCSFCDLVVEAVRDSAEAEIDPDQLINVLLFPEETSFRLSYPSPLGTRLSFSVENSEHVVAPDSARPISSSKVQPDQILHWLKQCDDEHEDCYLNAPDDVRKLSSNLSNRNREHWSLRESHTSNFRVLDVVEGCLKKVPLNSTYVTLSYVWGQLPMFNLLHSNVDQLFTPGALVDIYPLLPKTITDAIDLVRSLGMRNLWVDSLCLIQDAASDVFLGIELMNSIYSGSCFTIIASSGADASSGLPGTTSTPRSIPQTTVQLCTGLNMTATHSIDRQLAHSVYNQRGWTLQELVLSRRAIVFTHSQIHFRCQVANWSEGSWSDKWSRWTDADDSNISRIPGPYDGWLPSFWAYQKLCEDHSRRTLRHGGDALRAVAGLCKPLFVGMKTPGVEGLPAYYLDHFLLFVSLDGEAIRRPAFGSFSWAGWEGRVMWPRENYLGFEDEQVMSQDPGNILGFFQRDRLCKWDMVNFEAFVEHLSAFKFVEKPSRFKYGEAMPLLTLMKEFSDILDDGDLEAIQKPIANHFSCEGCHADIPSWETRTLETANFPNNEDGIWNQKALDMANNRVEFQRMARRMASPMLCLAMQNWWACERIKLHRAIRHKPGLEPVSMARMWERGQYSARKLPSSVFGNDGPGEPEDQRGQEVSMTARCFTSGPPSEHVLDTSASDSGTCASDGRCVEYVPEGMVDVQDSSEDSQNVHGSVQTTATPIPEIPASHSDIVALSQVRSSRLKDDRLYFDRQVGKLRATDVF